MAESGQALHPHGWPAGGSADTGWASNCTQAPRGDQRVIPCAAQPRCFNLALWQTFIVDHYGTCLFCSYVRQTVHVPVSPVGASLQKVAANTMLEWRLAALHGTWAPSMSHVHVRLTRKPQAQTAPSPMWTTGARRRWLSKWSPTAPWLTPKPASPAACWI